MSSEAKRSSTLPSVPKKCKSLYTLILAPRVCIQSQPKLSPLYSIPMSTGSVHAPALLTLGLNSQHTYDVDMCMISDHRPPPFRAICDFHASWCGPCHRISPVFEELSYNYTDIHFMTVKFMLTRKCDAFWWAVVANKLKWIVSCLADWRWSVPRSCVNMRNHMHAHVYCFLERKETEGIQRSRWEWVSLVHTTLSRYRDKFCRGDTQGNVWCLSAKNLRVLCSPLLLKTGFFQAK